MRNSDQLPEDMIAIDAEKAMVSAWMLAPDTIDECLDHVAVDDIFDERVRVLAETVVAIWRDGGRPNPSRLAIELRKRRAGDGNALQWLGGPKGLAALVGDATGGPNAAYYAQQVAGAAMLRRVMLANDETARDLREATDLPTDVARRAVDRMTEAADAGKVAAAETIARAMPRVLAELDARFRGERVSGISTGFRELDEKTLGMRPGQVVVLAARTSVGKTAFAMNLAANVAKEDIPVLFVSLEMSTDELSERLLASTARVDLRQMLSGTITTGDRREIVAASEMVSQWPIHVSAGGDMGAHEVFSQARRLKRKAGNLGLIVIDYLQLMRPEIGGKNVTRERELADLTRKLKIGAGRMQVPILLLAQLNRKAEEQGGAPKLSHLRECLSTDSTLLFTSSGVQGNIEDKLPLYALSNSGSVDVAMSTNVPKHAVEAVRVVLRSGRTIDCTPSHEIMTDLGWVRASDLTDEHAIASVRQLPADGRKRNVKYSRWMGWMLGNGGMSGPGSPSFICSDIEVANAFSATTLALFGLACRPHANKSRAVWQYDITWGYHTPKTNPCKEWLKNADMWGRTAKDKAIPQWFLDQADDQSLAELVGGLIDTDGSVFRCRNGRNTQIKYSTTSRVMMWQVVWCLSRLGVFARVNDGYMGAKATTPIYDLRISEGVEIDRFRAKVKLTGRKGQMLEAAALSDHGSNHGDRLGPWVSRRIKEIATKAGMTARQIGYRDQGKRISQRDLAAVLDRLGTHGNPLRYLVNENIFWDRLKLVTPLGKIEVFDRSVPKRGNFVANGIVVHNCGAIEQDADGVWFLWRTNGDDDRENVTLTIAKQRGGPTGDVPLLFEKEFTTFKDAAKLVAPVSFDLSDKTRAVKDDRDEF